MPNKQSESFKTADLALIAVLLLLMPESLEVVDRTNPHKVLFGFKADRKLEKLMDSFWKRELLVEPQAFFNQIKIAKARIYVHE
jgi:hypothetical protein